MSGIFNINAFISQHITGRVKSMFINDIKENEQAFTKAIKGRSVLVIGGAGTIGSSFTKVLLRYQPSKVIVVDINENGLTELVRDCRSTEGLIVPEDLRTYPINFNDEVFLKIFKKEGGFDIVANFAAHKHVRSEKDVYSIEAMIRNNVLHAKKFLDLLASMPPKHFFCVSTDKAANPVNIMGASKKLMEEFVLAYSELFKITTARFANVAFSNGSLLDGFIHRMMKGQPLSCPSDVKRYFVSPEESGEICLSACILGEPGDIFFPKLNEDQMVNFADIVEPFLSSMGYEMLICNTETEARSKVSAIKNGKYPVYFFKSDTSGEKLYEEFFTGDETLDNKRFDSLGVIKNAERRSLLELSPLIDKIEATLSVAENKSVVVALLNELLPGFSHIETGASLDQKM